MKLFLVQVLAGLTAGSGLNFVKLTRRFHGPKAGHDRVFWDLLFRSLFALRSSGLRATVLVGRSALLCSLGSPGMGQRCTTELSALLQNKNGLQQNSSIIDKVNGCLNRFNWYNLGHLTATFIKCN